VKSGDQTLLRSSSSRPPRLPKDRVGWSETVRIVPKAAKGIRFRRTGGDLQSSPFGRRRTTDAAFGIAGKTFKYAPDCGHRKDPSHQVMQKCTSVPAQRYGTVAVRPDRFEAAKASRSGFYATGKEKS